MAHDHDVHMLLADAAAQMRDEAGLSRHAPELEALAQRDEHRLYQGIANRAFGVLHRLRGEHAEAGARFEQALDVFHALDAPWQCARTYFELAELATARADPEAARANLAFALRGFEALKALPDIVRTRMALEALE